MLSQGLKGWWCVFKQTQAIRGTELGKTAPPHPPPPLRAADVGGSSPNPGQATGPSPDHRERVLGTHTRPTVPSSPLPTPTLQGTQLDSRRPGSRPRPRGLLGELYLDSMGIIRPYFPGQLSERLQVRREGLPLETPAPPPSQALQTSRVHCFWNNGPRSFQDQGEPIGCRSQQGPGPWQTPWQLEGSLGEHPDDDGLQWQRPRMRPSHDSHP